MSALWVTLALLFGLLVWVWDGPTTAGECYTGYVIEKALLVDDVFVFALIFSYFAVPAEYLYRVLFWGVFLDRYAACSSFPPSPSSTPQLAPAPLSVARPPVGLRRGPRARGSGRGGLPSRRRCPTGCA